MKVNLITGQKVKEEQKEFARKLRREQTEAENKLWEIVRAKKLGVKFRRQQVIDSFIVDFYCPEKRLIIEIDGDIHKGKKEYDKIREKILKSRRLKIMRLKNSDVLNNITEVKNKIIEIISAD